MESVLDSVIFELHETNCQNKFTYKHKERSMEPFRTFEETQTFIFLYQNMPFWIYKKKKKKTLATRGKK